MLQRRNQRKYGEFYTYLVDYGYTHIDGRENVVDESLQGV